MSKPEPKHRLTTLDATFLNFEKKDTPFHVGSTMIVDGEVSYEKFKAHIAARLPLLVRYQQKIVPAPYYIGHPSWEYDPNFDINNHIFQVQLDPPGTLEQLRVLNQQIQGRILDRNKPLWELYVINGVEGHRSAIITKVHHSMVDGAGGVELLNISFDQSPALPPEPEPATRRATAYNPGLAGRLFETWLETTAELTRNWFEIQRGLLDLGLIMLKQPDNPIIRPTFNPVVKFAAPVTMLPFNLPNSGQLEVAWKQVSFAEIHTLGERLGGTLNDVLLTAISGVVIRYLDGLGQKTDGLSLRLMVPVNMRPKDTKASVGNIVSTIFVDVPLDLRNTLKRHAYVVKETTDLKAAHAAEQYYLMTKLASFIPAGIQAVAGSLTDTLVPAVNMVCTNVQGPRTTLYIQGKKITHAFPYVPIAYAVGVTWTIFSYDGQLFISLSSDGKNMPGLGQQFMLYLEECLAELRQLAGLPAAEVPETLPAETVTPVKPPAPEPPALIRELKQLEDKTPPPIAEPAAITPPFKSETFQLPRKRRTGVRGKSPATEKVNLPRKTK